MRDITTYWFTPDHQPKPDEPVEFELRPLDLRMAYEVQVTMHENGAVASEAVRAIFTRFVLNWRGVSEPCTPENRRKVLDTSGDIFGFPMRDWLIWTGHASRDAFLKSILTEEEKKTS